MRILVTGASGQLGKDLLLQLNKSDHDTTLLVRNKDAMCSFLREKELNNFSIEACDICSQHMCMHTIKDADIVIHLAAIIQNDSTLDKNEDIIKVNFQGTLNVLNAMVINHVDRLIFPSSTVVYGDNVNCSEDMFDKIEPKTTYALSKILTEEAIKLYARLYDINYVVLRCAYLYGIFQTGSVVEKIIEKVAGDTEIAYGNDVTKDFLNTEDVAKCIITFLSFNGSDVFNVGTGVETSITRLISMIQQQLGTQKPVRQQKQFMRPSKLERWRDSVNVDKLKSFGFKPEIGISEGIRRILESRNKTL